MWNNKLEADRTNFHRESILKYQQINRGFKQLGLKNAPNTKWAHLFKKAPESMITALNADFMGLFIKTPAHK